MVLEIDNLKSSKPNEKRSKRAIFFVHLNILPSILLNKTSTHKCCRRLEHSIGKCPSWIRPAEQAGLPRVLSSSDHGVTSIESAVCHDKLYSIHAFNCVKS